jgi:hypothetical protein
MEIPAFTVEYILRVVLMAALGFSFGAILKVSDLLQEHGFTWFKGSANATGLIACGIVVGSALYGGTTIEVFWLAMTMQWVLRGRIDGVNHGWFAIALLLLPLLNRRVFEGHLLHELLYFVIPLAVLGLIHDLLQYTNTPAPKSVRWFFANQHLYYYLVAFGYVAVFRVLDLVLLVHVWAFVKGYGYYYNTARYAQLERVGIRQGSA